MNPFRSRHNPELKEAMVRTLLVHIRYNGMEQGKFLAEQYGIDWEQFKRVHSETLVIMALKQ